MASSPALAALGVLLVVGCGLGGGGITPIQTAFNRGVYHDAAGAYDLAVAEYREALEDDPRDFRARFNLGAACEAWARARAAAGDAAGAAELRATARAAYEEVLRQIPDHPRASVNLAALEYETDPEAAKTRLRALIERHPDRTLPRTSLAAMLLAENDPAAAAELLAQAQALDPTAVPVNLLLGDARRARGDLDGARAAYRQALRRDPDDLSALLALARLETAAGRPAEAAVHAERLLHIDPDHHDALLLLADASEAQGELETAVMALLRAKALTEDSPEKEAIRERLRGLYERLLATGR